MGKGFEIDLGQWFTENRDTVRKDLDRYFDEAKPKFCGRAFEKLSAQGDPNRFEASDIIAAESVSGEIAGETAVRLLFSDADRLNRWLKLIPSGRDLWEVEESVVGPDSAAFHLCTALDELPDIGWITAGKLLASKRPRFIPILDKEVKDHFGLSKRRFWGAMHDQLSDDERRSLIAGVCDNAPADVSLLRRIEVALWMYARHM